MSMELPRALSSCPSLSKAADQEMGEKWPDPLGPERCIGVAILSG